MNMWHEGQARNRTWYSFNLRATDTLGDLAAETDDLPTVQIVETSPQESGAVEIPPAGAPATRTEIRLPVIEKHSAAYQEVPRTAPIQIWEGRVVSVDRKKGIMEVLLSAKFGEVPDHTGEISLEWVVEQDAGLVVPGAIFYWTLYKETKRGSISNSQELRFRRLPSWSRTQIENMRVEAEKILARIRSQDQANPS